MPFITQGKTNWKFLLIVIILAVLAGVVTLKYFKKFEQVYQSIEIQKQAEASKNGTTSNGTAAQKNVQPQTSLSYDEAVSLYANQRIQFGPDCAPIPNYLVVKKGTKIMLDNRYEKGRPIFLDGQRYNLEPYGFKIVTLTTNAALPHTVIIDCGTGRNNGQILLQ